MSAPSGPAHVVNDCGSDRGQHAVQRTDDDSETRQSLRQPASSGAVSVTPPGGWPEGWEQMTREQKLEYVKRKLEALEKRAAAPTREGPAGLTAETDSGGHGMGSRPAATCDAKVSACFDSSTVPSDGITISSDSGTTICRFVTPLPEGSYSQTAQLCFISASDVDSDAQTPLVGLPTEVATSVALLPRLRGARKECGDATLADAPAASAAIPEAQQLTGTP